MRHFYRLRFSLRALLLTFIVMAVAGRWWHVRTNYHEQHQAVRELAGMAVLCDVVKKRPMFPRWPIWLIGNKQYYEIDSLTLEGIVRVSEDETMDLDTNLSHLLRMSYVTKLTISGDIGDGELQYLRRIGSGLKSLAILGGDPRLTDEGLAQISSFSRLEELRLHGGTCFTEKGIRSLTALPTLRSLDLSMSGINDDAINAIASLTSLKKLDLSNTAITNARLWNLCSLVLLEELHLYKTLVDERGIDVLHHCLPKTQIYTVSAAFDASPLEHSPSFRLPTAKEVDHFEP